MEEVLGYSFSDLLFAGIEFANCNPFSREKETSWFLVVGLLADDKGDSGVSSGEAGLEGIYEEEIGEKKWRHDQWKIQTRRRKRLEVFFFWI